MRSLYLRRALLALVAAMAAGMVSGSAGVPLFAQESGGLPEGFVKRNPPGLPPADQIEAGRRVYFTKCVW